ncbi:hypothetical protein MLD38_000220 [Melastoma candidum]|uniref:Uncharacterized protein n=1 Tax=Melastoma candidum TaxID=119954 RepID=A0ACB9SBB3_9MYRT|nr:hypothetical protein MLD38_000220 [Melastoma candidum]
MDLSLSLSGLDFRVNFLNTTHNNRRIAHSNAATGATLGRVCLVSVPEGMETQEEGHNMPRKLSEADLPRKFEELIEEIIREDDEGGIDCVVADQILGWAMDIATRKGIKTAVFCLASGAQLVFALNNHHPFFRVSPRSCRIPDEWIPPHPTPKPIPETDSRVYSQKGSESFSLGEGVTVDL